MQIIESYETYNLSLLICNAILKDKDYLNSILTNKNPYIEFLTLNLFDNGNDLPKDIYNTIKNNQIQYLSMLNKNDTRYGGFSYDDEEKLYSIYVNSYKVDNYQLLKRTLLHEIQHLIEAIISKGHTIGNNVDFSNKKDYYNNISELSAHLTMWIYDNAHKMKSEKEVINSINNYEYIDIESLTNDNKKRLYRKALSYWNKLNDSKNPSFQSDIEKTFNFLGIKTELDFKNSNLEIYISDDIIIDKIIDNIKVIRHICNRYNVNDIMLITYSKPIRIKGFKLIKSTTKDNFTTNYYKYIGA